LVSEPFLRFGGATGGPPLSFQQKANFSRHRVGVLIDAVENTPRSPAALCGLPIKLFVAATPPNGSVPTDTLAARILLIRLGVLNDYSMARPKCASASTSVFGAYLWQEIPGMVL